MESAIVNKCMKLIEPLDNEVKLELLSRLSSSLRKNFTSPENEKEKLLEELAGAWKDMEDETLDDIMKVRSNSEKDIIP